MLCVIGLCKNSLLSHRRSASQTAAQSWEGTNNLSIMYSHAHAQSTSNQISSFEKNLHHKETAFEAAPSMLPMPGAGWSRPSTG